MKKEGRRYQNLLVDCRHRKMKSRSVIDSISSDSDTLGIRDAFALRLKSQKKAHSPDSWKMRRRGGDNGRKGQIDAKTMRRSTGRKRKKKENERRCKRGIGTQLLLRLGKKSHHLAQAKKKNAVAA